MQLLVARTLTIGFILGFTHLVTIPAPVLCSHDCGEIHVLGATEHISHDLSHDSDGDHDHDADHGSGHGCEHSDGENPHDDASCVDVTIAVDSVLPPSNSDATAALLLVAVLTHDAPSIAATSFSSMCVEDAPPDLIPPLPRLGRLLI